MKNFIVSAPGKVILFGEHAVVHNKPAIAAAVSLRTYTGVEDLADTSKIELDFADIKFDHQWAIEDLPWNELSASRSSESAIPTSLDQHVVDILNETALKGITNTFQHAAAFAFIYLYMSICSRDTPGKKFTTRSTLPVGAGLGSSACLSVCLSSALLRVAGQITNPEPTPSEEFIDLINNWAFIGECCIHGNPSGIDNTVATRGGAVKFRRPNIMEPIANFPPVKLVLTNTGYPRRTSELVANVGKLRKNLPTVVEPILDAIEHVSEEAYKILNSGQSSSAIAANLGSLVHINHALLVALGVSHPALEQTKYVADSLKLGETKLTGAGGGGCAITLVTEDVSKEEVHSKVAQLREKLPAEFQIFDTILGGPGVGYTEDYPQAVADKFASMENDDFEKLSWSYWSS
ncbi:mevalonate kinase [Sugiyamaella lignohabitans]|uniref:Mevalonate kinase n=1 Tax=Sugiyamaella lignohabitans TaxID=796027 RepID=A0A167CPL2_9ASCO|nr:mevalonate kinase [Sugiyamaella lignohabitans]ANB11955.1 mevalonate kinase [Sugiyamaella lignohabitans]